MIRIQINSNERKIQDADPDWINEQINRWRRDGQSVCVRIQMDDVRAYYGANHAGV
jgi:hypothetical protein